MIPKKAELSSQTLVLQDQNTPFDLSRVVQAREVFIQQIKSILELRWPASQVQTLIKCNIHPLVSEDHPYVGLFEFRISCVSLAEAVLVAEMIESSLAVMFQIKYRTSIPGLPVQFKHQNKQSKQQMAVSLFYRQEDYINGLNLVKKPHFDHEIYHVFRDSKRDYYDYWIAKKNIPDLRLMEPNRQIGGIRSTLQATAKKAIENTGEPAVLVAAHDARILAITLIGAGAGNYMHALRVINKLAEKMPKLRIDWVLADTDLPVPRLGELPPLVTVHRARGLEQLYPLIQYLSLEVDVVIGLPNNFLGFLQKKFGPNPMLLSNKCPYMVVSEYNISPNPVDPDNPLYDIELRSGMTKIPDEGLASLGIIKPERMDFPVSKEQKRQALQADSKCERMFVDHPEVPFYFAYVYAPEHKRGVDQLLGLRNVDVLAFFIQYAKSRTETQIKMVLSIRAEDIQLAKTIYPKILENCTIQLYSQQDNMRQVLSGDGVTIQVYDLFPFENITFRALSDYAVSWDTPVVMTGDQSFFELFFTNNSPVMLYQPKKRI